MCSVWMMGGIMYVNIMIGETPMKYIESFQFFKVWIFSLLGYDALIFLYLLISGRVFNEMYGVNFVSGFGMFVLFVSAIVGVTEIIYAIVQKTYHKIMIGVGILGLSFVLFVLLLVVAIADVWG